MIKKNRIAYGVRVKLNDNFEKKCLGDDYLVDINQKDRENG